MTLTRVREPIFKSANPNFNQQAAKWAYDLVMKMDEDTAAVFTEIVVAEVLEDTIAKNERTLQRHLNEVVAKRIDRLKKATLRAAVSKGADVIGISQALDLISKKTPYEYGYQFSESDFNRDPESGRFRTKIKHNPKTFKQIHGKQAAAMHIPKHPKVVDNSAAHAQFQDEYQQLAMFLGAVAQSGGEDQDVMLHLRHKGTGQTYTTLNHGTRPDPERWDPTTEELIGATAKPVGLTYGGAAFGLTSALGAQHQTGMNAAGLANSIHSQLPKFSDDWMKPNEDLKNSNAQLYNRMQAGSAFLGGAAPPGSKVQMAAKFGEFVGEHGAEAEKVIGPTARKTAYRYRGTEKKPSAEVIANYGRAVHDAKRQALLSDNPTPSQMAAARQKVLGKTPTWEERDPGRGVLREYLWDQERRPEAELYNLQLASGNTPPSEGFIINRDGQIAVQAIGYGDDHYLPFNLKNLKSLKGGEYIRTRSVGGPTSEDIYTGLLAGARQITVVSRSGTFKVTFEDDFRGGRRHNDKALRMVRRYEQILDAVQSEQVDRKDIDPETRVAITRLVRQSPGVALLSSQAQQKMIANRIKEFKSSPELTADDEKLINAIATSRALHSGQGRDASEFMRQATNDIAAEKEYKFRLNGIGYEGALKALREQFPYYIKVDSVPTRDPERQELGIDYGYVEPGKNRPTAASAGLFGAKNTHKHGEFTGKFSAAEANYQSKTGSFTRKADADKADAKKDEKNGKKEKTPSEILAEANQKQVWQDAADAVREHMKTQADLRLPPKDRELLDMDIDKLADDPVKRARFDTIARAYNANENVTDLGDIWVKYMDAAGDLDRKPFDKGRAGTYSEHPMLFNEDAYKPGADPALVSEEWQRIQDNTLSGVVVNKPLREMSKDEVKAELAGLRTLATYADNPMEPEAKVQALKDSKQLEIDQDAPGLLVDNLLENKEAVTRRMEWTQRAHALNAGVPAEQRARPEPGPLVFGTTGENSTNQKSNVAHDMDSHAGYADLAAEHLESEGDPEGARWYRNWAADIRTAAANEVHGDTEYQAWVAANSRNLRDVRDVLRGKYGQPPSNDPLNGD